MITCRLIHKMKKKKPAFFSHIHRVTRTQKWSCEPWRITSYQDSEEHDFRFQTVLSAEFIQSWFLPSLPRNSHWDRSPVAHNWCGAAVLTHSIDYWKGFIHCLVGHTHTDTQTHTHTPNLNWQVRIQPEIGLGSFWNFCGTVRESPSLPSYMYVWTLVI